MSKELTAQIVAAYVSHNNLSPRDLGWVIRSVRDALSGDDGVANAPEDSGDVIPLDAKRSLTRTSITCLECGWTGKMLKNHLRSKHSLEPYQYRDKHNLPSAYPMVAPDAALKRSELMAATWGGRK